MKIYQKISDTLQKYAGISIPVDKVEIIYRKNFDLLDGIEKWGMDTIEREETLNVLARFFLECEWPTYGDSVNFKEFHNRLVNEIAKFGFTK
ncbi:hypothetical protein ZPAH1_orf00181 [Aeromonas phage ZPAH1]|nr:hypothetical protein ZPAH1_orf00181 [Aeromonas phage ZPAH1]